MTTTLTITQRLQEGDTAMERSVTLTTPNGLDLDPGCNLVATGNQLLSILHAATWTTTDKPTLSTPQ